MGLETARAPAVLYLALRNMAAHMQALALSDSRQANELGIH
jgi:hypothetical protein